MLNQDEILRAEENEVTMIRKLNANSLTVATPNGDSSKAPNSNHPVAGSSNDELVRKIATPKRTGGGCVPVSGAYDR